MASGGKKLTNDNASKYPSKPLVFGSYRERRGILFSFIYFDHRSIPNVFGLGNADSKWHIAILERLKSIEMLDCSWEDILSGRCVNNHDTLRIHKIDWYARNIPITREELTWLPQDLISNEEEFSFYQIAISKGQGRIIGFINQMVFYVVLFDYNHNIQPAKRNDYKIRQTKIGISQYDDLLCKIKGCTRCEQQNIVSSNIIYHYLDEDFYAEHCNSDNYSVQDIYEAGLIYLCSKD